MATLDIKQYANKEGFKAFLWLLLGVFVLFFFGQIIKTIKKLGNLFGTSEEQKAIEEKANDIVQDVSNQVNGTSVPKPLSYYKSIADTQYNAMQYSGTNVSVLLDSLKNLSSNELLMVFSQFGMRPNFTFGYAESLKNLAGWYVEELTDFAMWGKSDLEKMRDIWASTSIRF